MTEKTEAAIDRLLDKHLAAFDLGTFQLFERLENDDHRLRFLEFVDRGTHMTAPPKAILGEFSSMSPDEQSFCTLMTEVFNGETIEQFLQRPCRLAAGWATEYLSPDERWQLLHRMEQELLGAEIGNASDP